MTSAGGTRPWPGRRACVSSTRTPAIFPGMSVAENLAIGATFPRRVSGRIDWAAQRRHAAEVLRHFRIAASPADRVDKLGPATRTMIAIARALQDRREARDGVLVLDEPTASLPRSEVVMLLGALRHYATSARRSCWSATGSTRFLRWPTR